MNSIIDSVYIASHEKIISALAGGSDPTYLASLLSTQFSLAYKQDKSEVILLKYYYI